VADRSTAIQAVRSLIRGFQPASDKEARHLALLGIYHCWLGTMCVTSAALEALEMMECAHVDRAATAPGSVPRSGSFRKGRHESLDLPEDFAGIADDEIMCA
jgi:hypothetical protein